MPWPYCKRSVTKLAGAVLLCAVMLSLTACDRGTGVDAGVPLALGQEPYLRYCAACHGNQGQGRPPAFPPLAGSEWMGLPPKAHALIILYGLRGEIEVAGRVYRGFMPPMQNMSDQEIADVLAFMDAQWGPARSEPALTAADIAVLREARPGQRQPLYRLQGVLDAVEALP